MNATGKVNRLNLPQIFFPLVILLVGLVLIIITPIGANYDEETYMARIYEMASGHVMSNSYIGVAENYPRELISNSYRQDVNLWPVDGPTWKDQIKDRIDWNNRDSDSMIKYKTRAVYFPTLFVIQAIIMRILGMMLNIPIVFIYYAIRLSYLLIYVLLVTIALRIIPFGKWILGAIAVGPMALILASSISPDAIIFGISFIFTAWILYLNTHSNEYISKRNLIITCVLILAICTLKPNYIFLLFLLVALPYKGFLKRKDIIAILLSCIVGVVLSLGWTYLGSKVYFGELNIPNDSTPRLLSLFTAPLEFISSLVQTISRNTATYIIEAIGVSGYAYWRLPTFIYFLYPFAVFLSFFAVEFKTLFTTKTRLIFLLTGLLNFLAIFAIFFISNTPLSSQTILGVTGRYFIPFILLLLLPLVINKPIKIIRPVFCILMGLIFIVSSITLFFDFHIMCGESLTSPKPCVLPYYKNWGPETFVSTILSKGSSINQNIIADCQNISQVEIWPLRNDELGSKKINLNVRSGAGDLLASSSFAVDGISINKWYNIDIPDVVGMKGTALTIEISPAEGQDLSQFALGVFPTDEYTKGELFIKDGATGESTSANNDLIFKYRCEKAQE